MTDQVGVVGAGAWGTTLAIKLASAERPVTLWAHTVEAGEELFRPARAYSPADRDRGRLPGGAASGVPAGGAIGPPARDPPTPGSHPLPGRVAAQRGEGDRAGHPPAHERGDRRGASRPASGGALRPQSRPRDRGGSSRGERRRLAGRRSGRGVRHAPWRRALPDLHESRPDRRRAVWRPQERRRPGGRLRRRARIRRQR